MKPIKTIIFLLFFLLFFQTQFYSQDKNLFAGIEIGSKGIKVSVINVNNIKKGDYEVITFWTDNVGIAKGISKDGNLVQDDINNAIEIIVKDYSKLKKDHNLFDENIFIVGSSGVGMAKNVQELVAKVKEVTKKDMDIIDVATEAKMLLKGCVPPKFYKESVLFDIGGGNTKGGYVKIDGQDENLVFSPLKLNYGTITLTEAVLKKMGDSNNLDDFNIKSFGLIPTVRDQINDMYALCPDALVKPKVYFSGGAIWAFYTLFYGDAKEPHNVFKLEDVLNYDAVLKNNFEKYRTMGDTNKLVAQVLKTYSQQHLISGNNILLALLESIPDVNSKTLYFAKEGQIAWLVSYVVDKSKKIKKVN